MLKPRRSRGRPPKVALDNGGRSLPSVFPPIIFKKRRSKAVYLPPITGETPAAAPEPIQKASPDSSEKTSNSSTSCKEEKDETSGSGSLASGRENVAPLRSPLEWVGAYDITGPIPDLPKIFMDDTSLFKFFDDIQ